MSPTFSYRDRLEGIPIHDEQGSYDRPHFLTCHFDPQKIDGVLKTMGRKPWSGPRPRLTMVLVVHGRTNSGILSSDGAFDADMREALANAARRYGLTVNLPSVASLQSNQIAMDTTTVAPADRFLKVAEASNSELAACWRHAMERRSDWMDCYLAPCGKRTALPMVRPRRQL